MLVRSSRRSLSAVQRAATAALPVRERYFHAESSKAAQLRLRLVRSLCADSACNGRRNFGTSAVQQGQPKEKEPAHDDDDAPGAAALVSAQATSISTPHAPASTLPLSLKPAVRKPLYRAPSTSSLPDTSSPVSSGDRSSPKPMATEPPNRLDPRQLRLRKTARAQKQLEGAIQKAGQLRKAIEAERRRKAARAEQTAKDVKRPSKEAAAHSDTSTADFDAGSSGAGAAVSADPDSIISQEALQPPSSASPRRRLLKEEQYATVHAVPPTREDLEALRTTPPKHAKTHPLEPNHLVLRTALFNKIKLSFLREQLFTFASQMGRQPPYAIRRDKLIDLILDHWGWGAAPLIPAKGVDAPHSMSLELTPPVVYLLVRDTAFIHSLTIRKGLSIEFSPNPLSRKRWLDSQERYKAFNLVVRGPWRQVELARESLEIKKSLLAFTKWTQDDMLGWTPPDAVVDQVSAEGGAFVDRRPNGKTYVAHYFQKQRCENAKDTLIQASTESMALRPYRPLYALETSVLEAEGPQYAMLPHMPTGFSPLPWTMGDPAVSYRVRQISGWSVAPGLRERAHQAENLAQMNALLCRGPNDPYTDGRGQFDGLMAQLRQRVAAGESGREGTRETVLQFGHVHIVPPLSTADPLVAPLPEEWGLSKAQAWAQENPEKLAFAPSLTPTMMHFHLPGHALRSRRLTYVRPPPVGSSNPLAPVSKAIFTYKYNTPIQVAEDQEEAPKKAWHQQLKDYLAQMETPAPTAQPSSANVTDKAEHPEKSDEDSASKEVDFNIEIQREAQADMMLPGRSVDVRVSSSSRQSLPASSAEPEMTHFFTQLAAGTLPPTNAKYPAHQVPLHTIIDGVQYVLHEDVELEVVEAPVPVENGQKDTGIRVRMVKSVDKVFPQQEKRYSEMVMDGDDLTPAFWQHFASISRDVRGETAALRLDRGLFG